MGYSGLEGTQTLWLFFFFFTIKVIFMNYPFYLSFQFLYKDHIVAVFYNAMSTLYRSESVNV